MGRFISILCAYIASVDRDVVLRQLNPNGPSDQVTCNQLDVHFSPKPRTDGRAEPVIVDPRVVNSETWAGWSLR